MKFYGQVVHEFKERFVDFIYKLEKIKCCGVFDATKSSIYKKINEYDLLLFPTHWNIEWCLES